MKHQIKHFGRGVKGKFVPFDPMAFKIAVARLNDKDIEVTIKKKTKARSLNQNSYMWGVVYAMIAEENGNSGQEIHEAMKIMFLRYKKNGLWTLRSTSSLNTDEMETYLENIRRWAAQFLSVSIPLPNEVE